MKCEEIRNVAVIGAGNMGHQIAVLCALRGFETRCTDNSPEQLQRASSFAAGYLPGRVAKGKLSQEEADAAAQRLEFTPDFSAAVRNADFVIEAVFDNAALKCEIFSRLDAECPPKAILVTNSSMLPSSKFAPSLKDASRLCNMHFFNPALVMKCVEVMRGPHTSDETFDTVAEMAVRLGKVPVRIRRELDGMIVNRIHWATRNEAFYIMEAGYASPEDIDNAVTGALGHPMGPFRLADLTGIDLNYQICMEKFRKTGNRADLPWPSVTEKYFKGEWGEKTGRGFYDYSPKNESSETKKG